MAVAISAKPDSTVYNMGAPVRATDGSRKFSIKWSMGSWAKSDRNPRRIQGYDIYFDIGCYNLSTKKTKTMTYQRRSVGANRTEWTIDLGSFKLKTNDSKTYSRSTDFYPNGGMWCIRSLTAKVRPYNSKGTGAWVTSTRQILQPRKPSISMEQNPSTGDVSWTVTHDRGTDYRENWTTRVTYEVWDSSKQSGENVIGSGDTAFGTLNTTHTGSFDVYGRMGKTYGQYVRVTVKAWSRGLWGASEQASKDFYVGWPMEPEITGYRVSSLDPTGLVTIWLDTHYKKNEGSTNPVTGVKLEKMVNVDYQTAEDIPGSAWSSEGAETGAVDDGTCTALSSTVAELQPERGKVTWVRVKAWNQIEDMFYRYSKPKRLEQLERTAPTAQDDEVKFLGVKSGNDGRSVVVTLAWDDDDSTGTEVSWSENENSWRSNEVPSEHQFTWDDGPRTVDGVSYAHVADFHVMGLEEGTLYHLRARRYLETDDEVEFGQYCPSTGPITAMPTTSPSSATLMTQEHIISGSALRLSWSYDSEATQRYWEVITGTVTETTEGGVTRQTISGDKIILASGEDSGGSCTIPWERWSDKVTDGSIPLAVSVSTGGDPVTSDAKTVTIAEMPSLSIEVDDVTAQPMQVSLTCNRAAEVSIVCTSQYAEQALPDGVMTQVSGDGILSTVITPSWTETNSGYEATVTLPDGLALIDQCAYTVEASATDVQTGLTSDTATASFSVEYAHKAPEPSEGITVTPSDVTEDGVRVRSATISLVPPESAVEGDLYDVYRVTHDGAAICASGVPLDSQVVDRYAPFGTGVTAYRVACRTADGSVSWSDYEYNLAPNDVFTREIRIDFGDDYVETDRGVSVSESWRKDAEVRAHLDGSRPAYWNESVARTGSVSGASIRVYEPEIDEAFRRLAAYPNVAYVRTSEGVAFPANVNVSIGTPSGTAGETISLSFEAIDSDAYMAVVPVVEEDDGEVDDGE